MRRGSPIEGQGTDGRHNRVRGPSCVIGSTQASWAFGAQGLLAGRWRRWTLGGAGQAGWAHDGLRIVVANAWTTWTSLERIPPAEPQQAQQGPGRLQ
jgi:hypothetical protein